MRLATSIASSFWRRGSFAESSIATKKRQELAKVIERLRSPSVSQGMARELRKQQAILEREIAELEQI